MASNTVPQNPTSHNVASLLPKLQDADSDIRYMTLNDLNQMLINGHQTFIQHDYTTCAKVVEGLLHTLNDSHGEVQNMAIKVLGPFVNKAPEAILCPTIEKVSNIKTDNTIDNSIPAIAVRAIVVALPHPAPGMPRTQKVAEAYNAVSKALIPRLVGRVIIPLSKPGPPPPKGMLQDDLETGNDSNSLDLLHAVAVNFGPMLQTVEVEALEQITMAVLESERCGTVLKKKAVAALSALAPYFDDRLLANHVSYTIEQLRQSHLTSQQRRLYITVYGSLSRSIAQKFGPYLKTLAPFVLAPLSQEELEQQREAEAEADGERDVAMEEVREAALVAIASFLESCGEDMRSYTREVTEAATRFLKYEPNVLDDDDEDMEGEEEEEDEFAGDEDFEEETGFEDEDDVSWKVRRDSAKALHALIGMLDAKDPAIYGQIAPALITRFKEREESVRTEVISTLAFLITKTGKSVAPAKAEPNTLAPSRKRRRGFSDSLGSDLHAQQALMNGYTPPTTPPPTNGATEGLAKINPEIVKGAAKLFKTSTPATKQALISLLKDMILAQHGGLFDSAGLVVDPVVEVINTAASSGSNVSVNAVRIEALALLRAIAETHSSNVIQPHLDKIIPAVIKTAKDRFAKVSGEAFSTIEVYIKALTPPRSTAGSNGAVLSQIFNVITERISAQETDTEVRQKAVQALGLLIGRTSGPASPALLSEQDRFTGQQLIADRMKNELTRLSSVRAVDTIAVLAQTPKDFKPGFVSAVALELGAQLRKSSRSLRGASLSALRMLAVNQASRGSMDDAVVAQLVEMFVPLLESGDLHMMGPALIVLASFAKDRPQAVATDAVINGICSIVRSPLSGSALDALIACVESIGQAGAGQRLMAALLDIAPAGDTDVTGQVIGTLLVSGGTSVGVQLDSFVQELQTQTDEAKRCLALSVLGEAGLRQGSQFALSPESFTPYFADQSEKVKLAAAVALGRAGAGNVKVYLPKILDGMSQGRQYLLLHSVKELLQHSTAEDEIRPYTKVLWENIISSGQAEDNKVVGAECVGRLAIIDPAAYLPQLHTFLQNPNPAIRGMVIAALRYVFSDTEDSYNVHLQATIVPLLSTMLRDVDIDNQRLSLTTFNSALHNKPGLVLPHLGDLLPYAMQASVIRTELIREVAMGPFKHKIDDGLEMRKSAYETLYALLESPASRERIDISAYYDRIVAGVADEHEIKILCCLVLIKLLAIAPQESARRLDSLSQQFRTVLAFKPKDNAVKQELEKLAEQQKAVVKVSVHFNKAFGSDTTGDAPGGGSRAWKEYFDFVKKDFATAVKVADEEMRTAGAAGGVAST
ncbi:putative TATA-binding protein interacting (TIP20) [Septoria linicola]|nr:putative TATA-binding protein interacting (TIP20) [Septoria linicola]